MHIEEEKIGATFRILWSYIIKNAIKLTYNTHIHIHTIAHDISYYSTLNHMNYLWCTRWYFTIYKILHRQKAFHSDEMFSISTFKTINLCNYGGMSKSFVQTLR